jgi:hypothetical protein
MKKTLGILFMVLVLVSTLAACGNNDAPPTPTLKPVAESTPAPTPETTPEPTPDSTPDPTPEPTPAVPSVTTFAVGDSFTETPETVDDFAASLEALRIIFYETLKEAEEQFNEDVNSDSLDVFNQILDDVFDFYDSNADGIFEYIDSFNDQQHDEGEIDIAAFMDFYNAILTLYMDSYNEILSTYLDAYSTALQAYLDSF